MIHVREIGNRYGNGTRGNRSDTIPSRNRDDSAIIEETGIVKATTLETAIMSQFLVS